LIAKQRAFLDAQGKLVGFRTDNLHPNGEGYARPGQSSFRYAERLGEVVSIPRHFDKWAEEQSPAHFTGLFKTD